MKLFTTIKFDGSDWVEIESTFQSESSLDHFKRKLIYWQKFLLLLRLLAWMRSVQDCFKCLRKWLWSLWTFPSKSTFLSCAYGNFFWRWGTCEASQLSKSYEQNITLEFTSSFCCHLGEVTWNVSNRAKHKALIWLPRRGKRNSIENCLTGMKSTQMQRHVLHLNKTTNFPDMA